jgi:hypothetical protein
MNDTKAVLQERLGELFEVVGVEAVNFKVDGAPGHPFTIGPRHVAEAADHYGGMLGDEVCERIPCAAKKCRRPRSAHTSDRVAFLKLKRNATQAEAKALLVSVEAEMKLGKVDGFCFVETEAKYRIGG